MYFKITNKNSAKTVRFLQKEGISYELSASDDRFALQDEVENFSLGIVFDALEKDSDQYYRNPEELFLISAKVDRLTEKPLEELKKNIPEMLKDEKLMESIRQLIQSKWNEITK